MRFGETPKRERPENVVPLINIVFLMLIFLMLAGTIAPRQALRAKAPRGADGEPAATMLADLVIDAEGRIAYLGEIVSAEELRARAGADAARHRDRPLSVLADRGADATLVLGLIDDIRRAGIRRIRLLTDRQR